MFPYLYIFDRAVPVYGICIVIGLLVASSYVVVRSKNKGLLWENAVIIGVCGMGFGFIGAKLLYVGITYDIAQLVDLVKSGKIAEVFNGGFVFYGGFIFGVIGALVGARIAKANIWHYSNILVEAISLAHAFGRIGCFCAGCCYGKPSPAGVVYNNPVGYAPVGIPLIPVQLYESVFCCLVFLILFSVDKKTQGKINILPCYLMLYGIGRFVLEYLRYDYVRGNYFGLSTSQIISVVLVIIGVVWTLKGTIRKVLNK